MVNSVELKRLFGRVYGSTHTAPEWRRVVLLYHAIGDGPWDVSETAFRDQMEYLLEYTQLMQIDDLVTQSTVQGIGVAVTFDDGYSSLHDNALEIMTELGIRATVYLSTHHIAEKREASDPDRGHYPGKQFLCWSDVEHLAETGWQIESHGTRHLDYTRQADDIVRDELTQSRQLLMERLNVPCQHFAYPWGRSNNRVEKIVQAVGFKWAATGIHGALPVTLTPYSLPRVNIERGYTLNDFRAIVRGDWDYLGIYQHMKRMIG
jgi:peptidoglycan/xylan/chitin deacetylase (PgdA/CDA1 family)